MIPRHGSTHDEYVIGIDLGGTKTLGVVRSASGAILHSRTIPTRRFADADDILADIARLVRSLEGDAGGPENCRGVGVGVAALVTPARTVIDSIILPAWNDVDVATALKELVGHPVVVDNDATMALISEIWRASIPPGATTLCLTLGTGVGAAVMLAGQVLRGLDGTAGQLGHMSIETEGRACDCGARGCLNAYVSGTALAARYNEATGRDAVSSGREVWDLAERGSSEATGVIASTGQYLGVALASLVNVFNPEFIVLAGGVATIGDPILIPAVTRMRQLAFSRPGTRATVVSAGYGHQAGAIGAAIAAAPSEAASPPVSHGGPQ